MEPKVSVILTSFNHEKFIGEAIQSVLNQSFKDFELIIVDDCSSDGSWEVISSFDDPRIIKVRNDYNMRYKGWFTVLKEKAKGKYIAIHHSDDLWKEDKLEKQVKFLENNSDYGAVFTHVELINENGESPEGIKNYYTKGIFDESNKTRYEWLRFFFYNGNALCHPSILIHKNLYVDFDLLSYGYAQLPDFSMWIKLCLHKEIHIIEEKLFKFRLLDGERNSSGYRPNVVVRSSIEMYRLLKDFIKLKSQDDVIKVFPEAKKYLINNDMVTEFAIAKMCLEVKNSPYNLFGLQTIFDLLNDETYAAKLEKLYNYSYMDFIKESDNFDVFNIYKGAYEIKRNLEGEKQLTIDDIVNIAIKIDGEIEEKRKLPVLLFGGGGNLEVYLKQIKHFGGNPVAIVDNNKELWGTFKFGLKIINIDELKNTYKNFLICITTRVELRAEIKSFLVNKNDINADNLVDLLFFKYTFNDNFRKNIISRKNELIHIENSLADIESKKVLKNVILGHLKSNIDYFLSIYDENEYFNKVTKSDNESCFVDAGAYIGDTLQKFSNFVNRNFKSVICIEPNVENCHKINQVVEKDFSDKEIKILNSGLFEYSGKVSFMDSHRDDSGRINTECNSEFVIDCISLDNIDTENVTFIKMDIEGAELEGLKGARKTIIRDVPKLAICLYHKPDDIFEIIKYIMDLGLPYNYYIKHHGGTILHGQNETVFYAIPN